METDDIPTDLSLGQTISSAFKIDAKATDEAFWVTKK